MAEHLTLRSANPALKADAFTKVSSVISEDAMTIGGTVNKTALALMILNVAVSWTWNLPVRSNWCKAAARAMLKSARWTLVGLLVMGLSVQQARAQLEYQKLPYWLVVEAFANFTAGRNASEDNTPDPNRANARIDSGLRILGLRKFSDSLQIGPRVVVQADTDGTFASVEKSLIFLDTWGRVEVGDRRGLPAVLTGYAPNNYTFVFAEFGPASGPSLDPDGRLQTRFLDNMLAAQIDSLSSLGITSSLFFDGSTKVIYVLPKMHGFLAGFSFSQDADDRNFKELTQLGLTYETYWQQNVLRVGGSFAQANGDSGIDDLRSFSAGVSVTLNDALTLGASVTDNGGSGLPRNASGSFKSAAAGYAASINYNTGPWTFGGYYQRAVAEGDTSLPGNDKYRAFELGLSYRLDTNIRLYGAGYFYRFYNEGGNIDADRFDGTVFLAGVRLTL